jgi:hypothetical protein
VTIVSVHQVRSKNEPESEKLYDGYVATGDDGNTYHCQYPHFDTWSTDPYSNWQRDGFDPDVHDVDDFILWVATKVYYYRFDVFSGAADQQYFLDQVHAKYPGALSFCNEKWQSDGYEHGIYYTEQGCDACRLLAFAAREATKESA